VNSKFKGTKEVDEIIQLQHLLQGASYLQNVFQKQDQEYRTKVIIVAHF
jgi:hypothetical protein